MEDRAKRIMNELEAVARLLRILAVDGYAYTSKIKEWNWKSLTTRQINRLLRRTGKATVTRDRSLGYNDYLWKLKESQRQISRSCIG